jgi:hypothetical protein
MAFREVCEIESTTRNRFVRRQKSLELSGDDRRDDGTEIGKPRHFPKLKV